VDDTLRRRLIGATVLLAVAFVVASLLPDPRAVPAGPSRAVTYDLRTGQPVEPLPGRGFAHTPPPAKPVEEAPLPRATLRVDETLGEPQANGWFVQIGSFESQSNARNVLQKLYGLGLPAVIQTVPVGGKLWYRVRVGPYAAQAEADAGLARVRKGGYPLAKLVKPDATASRERN
jgi:cell division septation protein DedD